ncbi:MAG TPA: mechanosensitive ion channel family protein [Dehalococcoidia bacterium]|nr:mechanosensitive ion channel family protein [Dehalococcoidia bacterium]
MPPFLLLDVNIDTDQLLEDGLETAGHILLLLVVALIALWLIRHAVTPVVRVTVREQMHGEVESEVRKRVETLSHVIYRTAVIVVVALVVVSILPEFGVSATPMIAGLGLVGLAVGFGAQNLVRDVINGLFILMENQYGKGDVVTVGGISGLVEDINLRRTVLRDLDGVVHFVPHSEITTASNFTKGFSRINFNVRVAYDSDLDKVFAAINRVGRELKDDPTYGPMIRQAPEVLRVDKFGDVGIEVKVVGETEPIEQWTVMGEMLRRLKRAFDVEGIVMPILPTGTLASAQQAAAQGPVRTQTNDASQ